MIPLVESLLELFQVKCQEEVKRKFHELVLGNRTVRWSGHSLVELDADGLTIEDIKDSIDSLELIELGGIVMKCVFCDKDLAKSNETIERRIKGRLYYVKNVPADVCKFCGEVYFDDEVVSTISKALEEVKQIQSTGTEVVDFKELNALAENYSGIPNKKLALI